MRDTTNTHDLGLLLIRVMLGVVFVFHGAQKLFGLFGGYGIEGTAGFFADIGIPFPTASVVLAGAAEFFGGLALVIGFGTRIAGLFTAVTMFVAAFAAHGGAFSAQNNGMEYPLTLAVVAAGVALTGSGAMALRPSVPR